MKAILATILVLPSLASSALAKPTTTAATVAAAPRAATAKQAVADEAPPEPAKRPGRVEVTKQPVAVDEGGIVKRRDVDEVSKLDLGLDYGLKKRTAALPDPDVEKAEEKALSENQVNAIVRERAEDLEYCWLRLPAKQRVVSAAILKLSIEASGKVAAVEVNGDMPRGVDKCIVRMASRWTFPAADVATEIDHGIMLTTTSQKTAE